MPTVVAINSAAIKKILDIAKVHEFDVQSDLYYEGHTPVVAYLIVEGKVQLTKNKKIKGTVEAGNLIGLVELLNHTPSPLGARILPNSKVCFIDKSTLLEILDGHLDDNLEELFKDIVSQTVA